MVLGVGGVVFVIIEGLRVVGCLKVLVFNRIIDCVYVFVLYWKEIVRF